MLVISCLVSFFLLCPGLNQGLPTSYPLVQISLSNPTQLEERDCLYFNCWINFLEEW